MTVKDRNSFGGSVVKQVNYEYDPFNRLVRREYDSDGAGSGAATNQYWIYDEGINAILQFDGSAASNLSHRYLWSNQVDELLADEQVTSLSTAGNTLWGLGDHLGTLRDIADFNESTSVTSVTNHRTYNAFGKLTAETNSAVDMLFGFTGKQLDEATELQHNLNRWYDSSIGQWLSEDPIGFEAGDENVRRYVANKATKAIDSTGLVEDTYWSAYKAAYMEYVNPWNDNPPVHAIDYGLHYGTKAAIVTAAAAAAAAAIAAAAAAAAYAARAALLRAAAQRQAAKEAADWARWNREIERSYRETGTGRRLP